LEPCLKQLTKECHQQQLSKNRLLYQLDGKIPNIKTNNIETLNMKLQMTFINEKAKSSEVQSRLGNLSQLNLKKQSGLTKFLQAITIKMLHH